MIANPADRPVRRGATIRTARLSVISTLVAAASPGLAAPLLPDFSAATFLAAAPIDNTYHPVLPGQSWVLTTDDADVSERIERSVVGGAGSGPTILGVATTTILDRSFENDVLVEETFDFFAQDTAGNVWYMGEDVTNYRYDDQGNFLGTDTESAWRAGVNDVLPGYQMPAEPMVGFFAYQEFAAADEALDAGEIVALGVTLDLDFGTLSDVLVILETSEIIEGFRELKYYAPGIGFVRADEGVNALLGDPDLVLELTGFSAVPVPPALPLLAMGLVGLGLAARGRGAWHRHV